MDRINTISIGGRTDLLPGVHFLCRLFWGPDARQCREMVQGGFSAAVAPLKGALCEGTLAAVEKIQAFLGAAPDPETLCRELEITYARLFLGAGQGLSAPPYQSCYLQAEAPLMGAPALRMRERLAAAGLSIAGQGNEPPDHLAVELEYLYFLLTTAQGDTELNARAVTFAKTELCPWLPLFSDRLSQIPDAAPYNHAAVLTRDLACLIAGEQADRSP